MEIKIAHCSDFHLGTNKSVNKFGVTNIERRKILIDVIEKCKNQDVKILLIAGDLLDDVKISSAEIQEIQNILSLYPEIKIFISPGNHDPFTPDSPYKIYKWPKNVHIFKSNHLDYAEIPELKTRVWGAAFCGIYQTSGLLDKVSDINLEFLNICVMHGNITSCSDKDYYNPIKNSEIEESQMDYIALGHIHKKTPISKLKNTFYAYSGSPFGSGFRETGDKGIYIGTISKSSCNLEFHKMYMRNYEKLVLTLPTVCDHNDILKFILNQLESKFGAGFDKNLYEITLEGTVKEEFLIDTKYLELMLENKLFFVKIIDKTTIKIDTEKLALRSDFKSMFIKKALKRINDSQDKEEKQLLQKALKIGIKAFSEDVKYDEN